VRGGIRQRGVEFDRESSYFSPKVEISELATEQPQGIRTKWLREVVEFRQSLYITYEQVYSCSCPNPYLD
jgi:hypothetical protein